MKNTNKQNRKGLIQHKPDYSVMIRYSKKAEDGKLIKIIPKKGKPIEISTKDLVSLLAEHVNFDILAPAFVESKKINMIRVTRNVTLVPNSDIKAGQTVHIPFTHMVPIEFAIAEEAIGVALIGDKVKEINSKEYAEAKLRVDAGVENYTQEQYRSMLNKASNNPNSS